MYFIIFISIIIIFKVGEKAIIDKVSQLNAEISALTKCVTRFITISDFFKCPHSPFRFRHPNLVSLMGYHQTDTRVALVYEYLEGGSLYSHIHDVSFSPII